MSEKDIIQETVLLKVKPEKYERLIDRKDYYNLLKIYMEAVFSKISNNNTRKLEFIDDIRYLIEDYIENFNYNTRK